MRRLMVLLAFAASPAAAQEATFERPYWIDRPVIESLGRAEVQATPDHASFSVTFREVARSARDALMAASDRARLAEAAIRSRGGDAVSVSASTEIETIFEGYRNREGERVSTEREDQIANYVVSVSLDVSVRDIARAVNVRAGAMAVGPEDASDLNFSLDDASQARMAAYRAAVEDAAHRARAAAVASGATLGRLLVVQEGQGPCLGRWQRGESRGREGEQFAPIAPDADDNDEPLVVTGSRAQWRATLSPEDIARVRLPEDATPIEFTAQVCAIYSIGP